MKDELQHGITLLYYFYPIPASRLVDLEVPQPAPACSQSHNNDEEIHRTLLTASNNQDQLERQPEAPPVFAEAQSPLTLPIALILGGAAFAFLRRWCQ
jgi:hypothetical protein